MKSRILALFLLVAMILGSIVTLAACGEEEEPIVVPPAHTHTFADGWKYDATNHWQETSCESHEVSKVNTAGHTYESGSEICSVCGYNNHTHTEASEWSFDDAGHWHVYTCCPEAVPTVEPHTGYEDDGICDECEQHVHTHGTEMVYDEDGHWYNATCEHTDQKLKFEEHVGMSDKVCDTCGFADDPIRLPIIGA